MKVVVEVRVERIGGSPIRHRKGTIAGKIKLRMPLVDVEQVVEISK